MPAKSTLLAVATAVLAMSVPQRTTAEPTIVNGSFESPQVSNATPGAGFGWGHTAARLDPVVLFHDNSTRNTQFGDQWIGLAENTSVFQTVGGFIAGQLYAITFFFFADTRYTNLGLGLGISGSATGGGSFTHLSRRETGPNGSMPFERAEVFFTPTSSGDVTFRFAIGCCGGDYTNLDNVSLRQVPDEASTLWLLLIATGGVFCLRGQFARATRTS